MKQEVVNDTLRKQLLEDTLKEANATWNIGWGFADGNPAYPCIEATVGLVTIHVYVRMVRGDTGTVEREVYYRFADNEPKHTLVPAEESLFGVLHGIRMEIECIRTTNWKSPELVPDYSHIKRYLESVYGTDVVEVSNGHFRRGEQDIHIDRRTTEGRIASVTTFVDVYEDGMKTRHALLETFTPEDQRPDKSSMAENEIAILAMMQYMGRVPLGTAPAYLGTKSVHEWPVQE